MRFHIVKRDSCPFWKKLCLYLAAVVSALVLGGLLLLVMGGGPHRLLPADVHHGHGGQQDRL